MHFFQCAAAVPLRLPRRSGPKQRERTWRGSVRGDTSNTTDSRSGTLSCPVLSGYSCFVVPIRLLSVALYHSFLFSLVLFFLKPVKAFRLLLRGDKADAFSREPQKKHPRKKRNLWTGN